MTDSQLCIPDDPQVRRNWIKYRLTLNNLTLADLARAHGVSRQAMSAALYAPNPRLEYIIASALDLQPAELWPERYHDDLPIRYTEQIPS